jgi:hypothetical protein
MSLVRLRALPLVLTCLAPATAGATAAAIAPAEAVAPAAAVGPVRGSLDKEVIRGVIGRHLDEVRGCYEQRLLDVPTLTGRVMIQFAISGDGSVTRSVVQNTTMNDPQVEACIAATLLQWVFPKPTGGGIVIVSYPFILKPAQPGAPGAPLPKAPDAPRVADGNAARAITEQSPAMPRVIARPDPQLPSGLAGQVAEARYHVCVGVDGRVYLALPIHTIPGANDSLVSQIRQQWIFAPSSERVCFETTLRFPLTSAP